MQSEEKINKLQELILYNKMNEAVIYGNQCMEEGSVNDIHLMICLFFLSIWKKESERHEPFCIFDVSKELHVLIHHYHVLKFLIRRLEFDWLQADFTELVDYCTDYRISSTALACVASASARNPQKVLEKAAILFQKNRDC